MVEIIIGIEKPFCEHTKDPANIGILWLTYQAKESPGLKVWCKVCCEKYLIIRQGEPLPMVVVLAKKVASKGQQAEAIGEQFEEPAFGKPPGSLNEPFVVKHSRQITNADRKFLKAIKVKCDD